MAKIATIKKGEEPTAETLLSLSVLKRALEINHETRKKVIINVRTNSSVTLDEMSQHLAM